MRINDITLLKMVARLKSVNFCKRLKGLSLKKRIIVTSLVIAATITGCTNTNHKKITEDDIRWDCRAMGNHICGKDLAPNGKWVREVTDKGEMWCWETKDRKGNVYLNLCGDGDQ